jgi:hypothetical protein
MKQIKRNDGLPPNFDMLPRDLQIKIEEDVYRRQLKWNHGFCPGDPSLTSMSASGVPVSGSFGKKVQLDSDVEVDVREDHD